MPHDQAVKLRLLVDGRHVAAADEPPRAGQSIVVYGAKGGVGTTTVALNLAVALSIAGKSVELAAHQQLNAPLSDGPGGIMLRAAASWRTVLRTGSLPTWSTAASGEPPSNDWLVVDGGVGDAWGDMQNQQHSLLVATAEPASILAAFDALRDARTAGWWPAVVWNRVGEEPTTRRATDRLLATARRMWGQSFQEYRLTESPEALIASRTGVPVVLSHPSSLWTHQMRRLAEEWLASLAVRAA